VSLSHHYSSRALFLVVLLWSSAVHARPGALDASFGQSGTVKLTQPQGDQLAIAVAIQPDQKIVAVGRFTDSTTCPPNTDISYCYSDIELARFNADGTIDTSFGQGKGFVTTDINGMSDSGGAVAIQTDGKIIVAGWTENGSNPNFTPHHSVAIVRYNADGSLDASFGNGGKVTSALSADRAEGYDIAVQPDGKIIVAGKWNISFQTDFLLLRYNSNGTPDSSFGNGGVVTTAFSSDIDIVYSVLLQPDGKIIAGGVVGNPNGFVFGLARYNSDGSLDTSFGTGGKVTTAFPENGAGISSLALQPDGRIVAVGDDNADSFALARYNTNGTLDTSFGAGGEVITYFPTSGGSGRNPAQAYAGKVESNGQIIAGGYDNNYAALVRYNTNGAIDSTFGTGGEVKTDYRRLTHIDALALQADGKLVAAGPAFEAVQANGYFRDFGLARYITAVAGEPGHLLNISTRLNVGIDPNVLIAGFVVSGTSSKQVLIRGLGPTLSDFGVAGALADPTLQLHHADAQGHDMLVASNDNWKQTQQAAIEATGKAPPHDSEAAILQTLAPGNYTAILAGISGTSGVGLVEVYDLAATAGSQLGGISSRGFVGTGDNAMIGGFTVQGTSFKKVIVRALGPTLRDFGVSNALADPVLELHDPNGTLLASNDNWKSTQRSEIAASGFAPPNDLESAVIRTVVPANYTAIVRGVNSTTGTALLEVYQLP
jgi:uncharacterized delta-60 repeat protein